VCILEVVLFILISDDVVTRLLSEQQDEPLRVRLELPLIIVNKVIF
jgi:hypothetical protein